MNRGPAEPEADMLPSEPARRAIPEFNLVMKRIDFYKAAKKTDHLQFHARKRPHKNKKTFLVHKIDVRKGVIKRNNALRLSRLRPIE